MARTQTSQRPRHQHDEEAARLTGAAALRLPSRFGGRADLISSYNLAWSSPTIRSESTKPPASQSAQPTPPARRSPRRSKRSLCLCPWLPPSSPSKHFGRSLERRRTSRCCHTPPRLLATRSPTQRTTSDFPRTAASPSDTASRHARGSRSSASPSGHCRDQRRNRPGPTHSTLPLTTSTRQTRWRQLHDHLTNGERIRHVRPPALSSGPARRCTRPRAFSAARITPSCAAIPQSCAHQHGCGRIQEAAGPQLSPPSPQDSPTESGRPFE